MLLSPFGRRMPLALAGVSVGLMATVVSLGVPPPGQASSADAAAVPDTQITGGPRDEITPGQPVSLSPQTTVVLSASEPGTFNCAVNAARVPCHDGATVLKNLKPGPQVFVAQAVSQEGEFDATPASLAFYLPSDLKPGHGKLWKRVKSRASYAGDYVSTTKKGAVLTVGVARGVREVRLIAPVGPRLGKVAIRVGEGPWLKVRLKSAESRKLQVFELRRPGARPLSGAIEIKAVKVPAGGAVAVDAIVAR